MDYYACEFSVAKTTADGKTEYSREGSYFFISSVETLDQWIDVDYDIIEHLMDEDELEKLPDGIYTVFVSGPLTLETDYDWESGIPDTTIIAEFEHVSIRREE